MPGPKLAVRITIIAFGLMILAGAWLVSAGDPTDTPVPARTPEQSSAEPAIPAIPKLSDEQRRRAQKIVATDPYVSRLARGTEPAIARPAVWHRSNGELLGAGVEVQFPSPQDFPVVEWLFITNADALYEEDPAIIEPRVRPEPGTFQASARNVEGLIAMVDLAVGRVISLSPTGDRVNLFPTEGQALPFELSSPG